MSAASSHFHVLLKQKYLTKLYGSSVFTLLLLCLFEQKNFQARTAARLYRLTTDPLVWVFPRLHLPSLMPLTTMNRGLMNTCHLRWVWIYTHCISTSGFTSPLSCLVTVLQQELDGVNRPAESKVGHQNGEHQKMRKRSVDTHEEKMSSQRERKSIMPLRNWKFWYTSLDSLPPVCV